MSLPKPLPHREEFEKHGETGTRFKFSGMRGEVGKAADAWLAEQQSKRDEECSARRDEREERTLSIAKEANSIASRALEISERDLDTALTQLRWAKWAAILAAIAAITANKEDIINLFV